MFNSILSSKLTFSSVTICFISSIILGIIIAKVHMIGSDKYTKNFIVTLSLLPLLVQVVMLMVNGNLGTSVAILGAFSLIRFRSIPGTSRELLSIFFSMAVGLALGMGQIVFACFFTVIASIMILILNKSKFGERKDKSHHLKITIPESLDYTNIFEDTLKKYTIKYIMNKVRTTNMGSMYELTYDICLRKDINEKEFIDELRIRNGNLPIILNHEEMENEL